MSLKEQISKDYLKAFKERNAVVKNLLSVVKGEIQMAEKEHNTGDLSDEAVTKILNKIAKSINEVISLRPSETANQELAVIKAYLPTQMSREEIITKVSELFTLGITNIGAIMKEFGSLPADKKIVSEVAKEILK